MTLRWLFVRLGSEEDTVDNAVGASTQRTAQTVELPREVVRASLMAYYLLGTLSICLRCVLCGFSLIVHISVGRKRDRWLEGSLQLPFITERC
jgi:hypothetical protein